MGANQSVDRTFDIIECFSLEKHSIGLSELSRLSQLPKATVFRLAETLVERGYLAKDPKEQAYKIGYKVLYLSHILLSHLDYRKVSLPYMKKILVETNQSVTLYIALNDRERLCVERFQSTQGLSRIVNVGDIFPIDRGAAGKTLLAFKRPDTLLPDYKITIQELEHIRRQGYAISHAEREFGVSSVAAPILDQHCQIIASLSVSGPSFSYGGENLANIISITKESAEEISRQLGYQL
ncbi:MAG: IclR family transcriptional regulator [Phycisphaerales bacterium]